MKDAQSTEKKSVESDIWPWILPFLAYMLLLMLDSRISTNPYASAVPVDGVATPVRYSLLEKPAEEKTESAEKPPAKSDVSPPLYLILTLVRVVVVGGKV